MKNSRRKFIKQTSQFTLVTGFTSWWFACGFSEKREAPKELSFLEIFRLFSDNMILPRNEKVPIWGWTTPNTVVDFFWNGKKQTVRSDKEDGKWIVFLQTQESQEPNEIKVKQDTHVIEIKNILLGDIYLCGGQSNMEWEMKRVEGVNEIVKDPYDPFIRHFKIPVGFSTTPQQNLSGGEWKICSDDTIKSFSAAAYFFAKNLREHQDIPIGLVNATKGGTTIKMWMPPETLSLENLDTLVNQTKQKRLSRIEKTFGPLAGDSITKHLQESFSGVEVDDTDWKKIQLPLGWGTSDFMQIKGKIWYRKSFTLENNPQRMATAKLSLANIDDADITFINGIKIGATQQIYDQVRQYEVEPSILKKGKNVIAICIENYGDFGGIFERKEDLFFQIENKKISLAGEWKLKVESWEFNKKQLYEHNEVPSVLFYNMIFPLSGFPMKGILWYQGEADATNEIQELFAYRFLFEKLIKSWRTLLGNENLPFVFAQLSNAGAINDQPNESLWARLRESQNYALNISQTAQVLNIDSGYHENTMHPQNKPELGKRFSLAVRKLIYDETIVASGPVFQRIEKEGNRLRLFFSETVKGLLLKNGDQVEELAIAGSDKKFRWAKSKVEGHSVVVWHEQILEPVAVRYAWADNPLKVNLYNSENLPAAPFRTDKW